MYEYEIYYRLDDSEYMETSSTIVESDSIEGLLSEIKSIEKRHTILYIKNLTLE